MAFIQVLAFRLLLNLDCFIRFVSNLDSEYVETQNVFRNYQSNKEDAKYF